jgi:nitrile hydratase beta subunit
MNGVHDLGGMHGFGPIEREDDEPVFHAPWERLVFAITRAARAQGLYNIDESRRAIERMEPARYLAASYYERWLASAVTNLVEKGVVTAAELEARMELLARTDRTDRHAAASRNDVPGLAERVLASLQGPPDFRRPGPAPKFAVGDRVLTRNMHPPHHTRLPRYARGKPGVIHAVHGSFVFPDTNAHGHGESQHPLYTVRFDARALWSESAEPGHEAVFLDLWESYLLPAPEGATS